MRSLPTMMRTVTVMNGKPVQVYSLAEGWADAASAGVAEGDTR